MLLQSFDLVER